MKLTFASVLTIVFIALKLTNVIDWSWWLVLFPLYGWLILKAIFYLVILRIYAWFLGL